MTNIIDAKKVVSVLVIAFVFFAMVITCFVYVDTADAETIGIITASGYAYIREKPTIKSSSVSTISNSSKVTIIDTSENDVGEIWYKIETQKGTIGYVRGDLILIEKTDVYEYDESFETELDIQGFPESYKDALRNLHAKYPNWKFVAQHTDLSWSDVIEAESKLGTTLVESSSIASWKSTKYPAYDEETGKFKSYDSGGWNAASKAIVKYYMDPRNFLSPIGIFQFFALNYDPNTQTIDGLNKILNSTFMAASNGYKSTVYETYADVIMAAGKEADVNPYVLASMIIVEQGTDGSGGSISGTQSGYTGLYNFYNIRAYKSGSYSAVQYGLLFAGATDEATLRPWNTKTKSIKGGALIFANNYVKNNKNTLYLKKWNVLNGIDSVGNGQYMTNVHGAESEAQQLRKAYSTMMEEAYTFYIPVYLNMPETACEKPTEKTIVTESDEDIETESKLSDDEKQTVYDETEILEEEKNILLEQQRIAQERAEYEAEFNELKSNVEATGITLASVKTSKGITVSWTKSPGYKVDYYEVYRSTSRNSGYGKVPYFTREDSSKCYYTNTKDLKKGQTYYFKVRGVRLIEDYDGNIHKVYTQYSNKSYRTVK